MDEKLPINGLSVDVEDWFQVSAFDDVIDMDHWGALFERIVRNCDQILEMLADADVKATFFTLGWIAKRYPDLMLRVANEGHELASHGWDNSRVYRMDRDEFARDLEMSRKAIEDATGIEVTGYRAPSFSLDQRTPWAYMILAEQGFTYSSSVAPVIHDYYGWHEAPRFAFRPLPWSELLELPVSTAIFAGRRLLAGGGGFFRVVPYGFSRWAIRQVNRREGRPAIFSIHPWEIDPSQPRVLHASVKAKLRKHATLVITPDKLRQLVGEFSWGRMDVLAAREAVSAVTLAA